MCKAVWKLYAILAAIFAALTSILAKLGIKGVDSNLATAIRTVVIIVLAWSIVFATGGQSGISSLTKRNWIFLILSGLATGLSWVFYYKAISIGKVSQVAPIDKASIVLTLILSFFILNEQFTIKTIIAGLLITSGTFMMLWK
jgi:transporter family protein